MRIYRYKMSRIEAIYRATTQENGWYLGRGWGGGEKEDLVVLRIS